MPVNIASLKAFAPAMRCHPHREPHRATAGTPAAATGSVSGGWAAPCALINLLWVIPLAHWSVIGKAMKPPSIPT